MNPLSNSVRSVHLRVVRAAVWVALLLLSLPGLARAADPAEEVLYLKNGDQLSGSTTGVADGALHFKSAYGELELPLDEVVRVEYPTLEPLPGPDELFSAREELRRLEAEANDWDGRPAWLERVRLTRDLLRDQLYDWTQRIALGGRYLAGNSAEAFADANALFERRYDNRFTQIQVGGQYGESRGVRGTNRWFANSTTDFNWIGRWIIFARSADQYDEFQNLDYRGTFSGGPGYRFFDDDRRRLIARMGPGVTVEVFHQPSSVRTSPDMFSEIELRWPLWDRISIEEKATIYPSLDNFGLVRLQSTAGLMWALDADRRWNLRLNFFYQFIAEPNAGRAPSDYTYALQLVYTRK